MIYFDTEFEAKIKNYQVSFEEVEAEAERTGDESLYYLYDYCNDHNEDIKKTKLVITFDKDIE
jgi:hypothetical protein